MLAKIIIPLLILLSFSAMTSVPDTWNICVPDGCSFTSSNSCGSSMCVNETVGQHISERNELFNAIVGFQQFIILAVVLLILLVTKKYFKDTQFILRGLYYKYKFLDYHRTKLFYYLSKLFSRGLLNPKIY